MSYSTIKANTTSKLTLFLIFISPSLAQSLIFEGISIGDLTLLFAVILIITQVNLLDFFIWPRWAIFSLVLLLWIIVSAYFSSADPILFSFIEFSKSFLKFIFYFFSALMVAIFFRKIDHNLVGKILLTVLFIHSLIAFYIGLNQILLTQIGISLPYTFFWYGQGGFGQFGEDLVRWNLGGLEVVKLRGVFGEPSLYGVQQAMGVAVLLFKFNKFFMINLKKIIFILITCILTISFSTIITLLLIALISVMNLHKLNLHLFNRKILYISLSVLLLIPIASPSFISNIFNELIIKRASQIIGTGYDQDRSATMRLLGSYDTAKFIVNKSPIFGSSLGNEEVFFEKSGGQLTYFTGVNESITIGTTIHNIPLYYLATLGYVGFSIFIIMLYFVMKGSGLYLGLVFVLSLATQGGALTAAFWVFYVLFSNKFFSVKNEIKDR